MLERADWGTPFRRVLEGSVGGATLAVAHHAWCCGARDVHLMALFERPEGRLRVSREAVDEASRQVEDSSRSLSDLVQDACNILLEGRVETSERGAPLETPEQWPEEVAVELSRMRPAALWVSTCEHSLPGGYARAQAGRIEASRLFIDGESYDVEPDEAYAELV